MSNVIKQSGAPSLTPHLCRVLLLEDLLEDVLEAPVVGLEDGVLGAHVQRPLLLDGILEAAVSKSTDGLCKDDIITGFRF